MPLLKLNLTFQGSGYGWQEHYWRSYSQENYDVARDLAMPLVTARAAMLGSNTLIEAIRISNGENEGRRGKTYYVRKVGHEDLPPLSANDALNTDQRTVNNEYGRTLQLRGLCDEYLLGPAPNGANDQFVTEFASYAEKVVSGNYGWMGIDANPSYLVTAYTVSPVGKVVFQVPGGAVNLGGIGKKRTVRIVGLNGKSVLNGEQVVRRVTTDSWELVKPTAAVDFVSLGEMYFPFYTFRQIANVTMQRVGRRAAGAPLLRSVGREKEAIRV